VSRESTSWLDLIREALSQVTDEEWVEEAGKSWKEHADRPELLVTFYGPYDSGKSSLLKRLLVEDGTRVPPWLTISGRRETFRLSEVASGGLVYRDTPGIAGGDQLHETIAGNALLATDVLVLTLPPQLMTTARDEMLAVISGAFFNPLSPVPFPQEALQLVVARADELVTDPLDDQDGFRDSCQRKQAELNTLLRRHISNAALPQLPPVHVTCADPDGLNARKPQPRPDDYAEGADWDGVAELRRALQDLPQRRHSIRQAAAIRYWSRVAADVLAMVQTDLEQVKAAAEEADRERSHIQALDDQLTGIDHAARADLYTLVYNELRSITDTSALDNADAIRDEAQRRMDSASVAWISRWNLALGQLAQNAAAELNARAQRPGATAYSCYLDELLEVSAPVQPDQRAKSARTAISYLGQWIPRLGNEAFRLRMHMSAADARTELAQLRTLRSTDPGSYFGTQAGLADPAKALEAKKHLKHLELVEFVPLLIEFASLIWAEAEQRQLARKERERLAKLRDDVEQAATEITSRIVGQEQTRGAPQWSSAVQELRRLLRARMPPDALMASMQEQQDAISGLEATLSGLLTSPPSSL
jgi:hypothetical protein